MEELKTIMEKFAASGWDLISVPVQQQLDGKADKDTLVSAIKQADKECGSCGCNLVSAEKVAYVMHICECRKQTACYSANKL